MTTEKPMFPYKQGLVHLHVCWQEGHAQTPDDPRSGLRPPKRVARAAALGLTIGCGTGLELELL